jgi:GPH family glycoside/pentoside/hexuronide:cation symporter
MKKTFKHIVFSLGNFSNTLAYQVFSNRIQFFYVDILGLGAATAGVLWTVYGLWNAINDPLMGQVSDRTRSRFGRRVPYVRFGAIPLGLSFFFLWTPPTQSPWILAAYFFMMLFVFDTLYSLTIIAYSALFPEVAPTPRERVNLATIREILATIGLLLAYILAPIIAEEVGYVTMGAIMGVLIAIGYLLSMIGVKEKPVDESEEQLGLGAALKIVFSSIPFRWYLGANVAKEYIWLALGAMLPFWRKYALGIQEPIQVFEAELSAGDAEAILLGSAIILAIPFLLVWQAVVPRLGYRKAWILGAFVFLPGLITMALANSFYTGLIGTLLISPGLAGSMIVSFPVISEVIDDDAKEHGLRREGIFFGMNGGITKLAFSAQGIFFASIMSAAGYIAGATVQNPGAVTGIRLLIGGTPILACFVAIFCMWRYPLGRETFKE